MVCHTCSNHLIDYTHWCFEVLLIFLRLRGFVKSKLWREKPCPSSGNTFLSLLHHMFFSIIFYLLIVLLFPILIHVTSAFGSFRCSYSHSIPKSKTHPMSNSSTQIISRVHPYIPYYHHIRFISSDPSNWHTVDGRNPAPPGMVLNPCK